MIYLPTIKTENSNMCFGGHVRFVRRLGRSGRDASEGRAETGNDHVTHTLTLPSSSQPLTLPSCHGQPHQRRVSTWHIPCLNSPEVAFNSIEIATRAADHFTRLYYSTYDSSTRVDDLPNFYRPNSAVSWNGNPYEGSQGLRDLVAKMPKTQHEVQSFDCHPIPGA